MSDTHTDDLIPGNDPVAVELLLAVRGGDVGTIRRLIGEHPDLPRWRIGERSGIRTPLHMVTDWPGYFPHGPEIARLLVGAGADPNVGSAGQPAHPGGRPAGHHARGAGQLAQGARRQSGVNGYCPAASRAVLASSA